MATTRWQISGHGYEFCNCDYGCGCNFAGFPNSKDGSCRPLVGTHILKGSCGSVDLSGVKCAALLDWPKAIHQGNGKCAFVVDPSVTDQQVDALAQIFTGKLGGLPWELLGPTFEVIGVVKAKITIEGEGVESVFKIDGVGEGRGTTFKNPVTGEPHRAVVDLGDGFIWKRGECGEGSYKASAAGVSLASSKTNWIFYNFDWSNAGSAGA